MKFMTHDATVDELRAACVDNHLVWMRRLARAGGGSLFSEPGLEWVATWQPKREVTVAITAAPDRSLRERIDAIGAYCRDNLVDTLSYWAMDESYAKALGVWLCARGLRPGGRPHWMSFDLHNMAMPPTGPTLDPMTMPDEFGGHTVPELFCYHPASKKIREVLVAERPQRVWHAVWWRDGSPIGNVSININDGELGVAGVHDLYVIPSARTPGVGLDRFNELRKWVAGLGCRYSIANAADEAAPLYRVMGFRTLGFGQTWWLPRHSAGREPSPNKVAIAEAVGEGDLDALAALAGPAELDQPLANGMTPLRLAAQFGRHEIARWLISHGAAPDLLAFWQLDFQAEISDLLGRDPLAPRRRQPHTGKSLLHVAVERNDLAFVKFLLANGADREARDGRWDGTPLDWAVELRRRAIGGLLRREENADER